MALVVEVSYINRFTRTPEGCSCHLLPLPCRIGSIHIMLGLQVEAPKPHSVPHVPLMLLQL
jgi:hypothetical protein